MRVSLPFVSRALEYFEAEYFIDHNFCVHFSTPLYNM